ncbi:Hpt domain-containing protein [Synechocystis sp. LKSZ1]|uniref:hybrid sensor histidine kinase/response regulator n=1 Tax=Synechocystis sp. LKSZ1 TaxID=3144951 RepID=UPI00336BB7EA
MINADIRDHAYQFFIEEAPELLQVIEQELLTLRQERTPAKIHALMRAAHSLKGGAASVGLPAIKTLAHRLEDIFKALYSEAVVIDEDMESLLLQAFDGLKNPLMAEIEQGQFDSDQALATGLPVIEAIEFLLGDHLAAGEQFLPSSADLGVDIVSSLFEVDIQQGLNQIQGALETEDAEVVRETLSAQTEVFAGLAELLNLPGFQEITTLVQTALVNQPEAILALAPVALRDWRQSCQQVLEQGDRQQGGYPSAELQALAGASGSFTTASEIPVETLETLWGNAGDLTPAAAMDNLWGNADLGAETFSLPELEPAELAWPELPPLTGELSQEAETVTSEMVNTDEPAYQFFIEEAPELLQMIEEGLLTLRQDRSAVKVHSIMRAAHSLKGGAASVGLTAIKTIAHRLEDIFKALHSETLSFDETLESLLLAGYDCLKNPLEAQIHTGYYDPQQALAAVQPVLEALEFQLGDALQAGEQFLPSSADLGVDIVANLFDLDIRQGLQQLREALDSDDTEIVRDSLIAQTEVFLGLAEILNLPGFKAIGEAVQKALENSPDQALAIAQQAVVDWTNSCDQVLQQGDRQQGGSPSTFLLSFGEKAVVEVKEALQASPASRLSISDLFFGDDEEEAEIPSTAETEAPSREEEIQAPLGLVMEPEILAETEVPVEATLAETILEGLPLAPSLEDVFGGLVAEETLLDAGIFADYDATPSVDDTEIDQMVQSVAQVFEQLPALPETPPLTAPELSTAISPAPTPTPQRAETPPTPTAAPLSIRVDFQRLERMNNWVGELAINRNSLSLQNQQLQGSVRSLLTRFSRFQGLTVKLRELADQLVTAPGGDKLFRPQGSTAWVSNAFDTLEMDSYSALSGQLQEILEEMMQLEEAVDDIVLFARASNQSLDAQKQMLFSLRDELMWARMLPLGEVLNRFPRVLRDLSTQYHKPVQLKLYGTSVLVDRLAIEKLYDPLLHLLRNAFDHGIESPEVRRAQGKPESGTIEIQAYHQGNQTIIEIRDDGGGLNAEKIAQRGIEKGLITEAQAKTMTPEQIYNLIFEPDFSTASQVSELSGRGVGLDVVRQQIAALKGTIVLSSRPGRGTTFSLRLPLTLTIAKLLVCTISQDDQRTATAIAIPSDSVAELLVPLPNQLKLSGNQRFLFWQGQMIPIYPLASLIPYNCPLGDRQLSKVLSAVPQPEDWNLPLILLRQGDHYYALEVTRLITEQELVIKPFAPILRAPDYLYGCTILGDGTLIPVINGGLLLEWYWQRGEDSMGQFLTEGPVLAEETLAEVATGLAQTQTILVVDDSAAMRRTLAFSLEKSGYRVLQAKDGREALDILAQTPGIQLVICDIEMPNLNGFEFLGQRRRNPAMASIPVAMLTSRGSDKHRQLATHLGANAYFTKPYIEQQFLTAIKELLATPALSV